MKIRVILTGATGMVGEGVLHECLLHHDVEQVLVLTRKPIGIVHEKLKEVLCTDFNDLSAVEYQLMGYNACFYCAGVSSIGMKEGEFKKLTYDVTINVAKTLSRLNPAMTFCYVSGAGTDSTETGRVMWARVKGKTENALMKLPFRWAYMFRPGYMHPTKGLKNTLPAYKYISWLYPLLSPIFPNSILTLKEVGIAMINSVNKGPYDLILETKDIKALAKADHATIIPITQLSDQR
jgi:uncharacterized protein YbjT (DUF2867 family)